MKGQIPSKDKLPSMEGKSRSVLGGVGWRGKHSGIPRFFPYTQEPETVGLINSLNPGISGRKAALAAAQPHLLPIIPQAGLGRPDNLAKKGG